MKKLAFVTLVILSVGLAMVVVGAIFHSITFTGNFNPNTTSGLSDVLVTVGYIVAGLSGVVLTALGVSTAIKGGSEK